MDMVGIIGQTAAAMKVIGAKENNMEKENTSYLQELLKLVFGIKEND